jgi:hypothetical protein
MHYEAKEKLPKHLTLTMMPWLSIIESTYKPEPEHVVQRTAPLAWQSVHRGLSPITFSANEIPTGSSILSSGIGLS